MVSIASLLGARHLGRLYRKNWQACLWCPWARHLTGRPTFVWKTGDPEMAIPERVRIYRPKYSDTIRFLVNGG